MSYCLNPQCPRPSNPNAANFCQACGWRLRLGDRYLAHQPLGEGGSSRTFLGLDTHQLTDARCIIKRFTNGKDDERFRQEAARLAALAHHPQIPDLYAYFERDSHQFLVQEWIEGRSLLQQLQQEGTFDETQIRDLLGTILPLLHLLHEQRIIHRDVKPGNLIRRAGGRGGEVWESEQGRGREGESQEGEKKGKNASEQPLSSLRATAHANATIPHPSSLTLVDFGAIKYATDTALARTGTMIGSAEYAAPEQLRGMATFASDLYSLGVTCIHLLTGLRPFELFDGAQGVWRWQSVAGEISPKLGEVLDRLLLDDLNRRYNSAKSVLQDLDLPLSLSAFPPSRPPAPSPSSLPPSHPLASSPWRCLSTITTETEVNAIAPTPDGKLLVSGGNDGIVRLWDLESGQERWTFEGHRQVVTSVAVTPDGKQLVSADLAGAIALWDLFNGKRLLTLQEHQAGVTAITLIQPLPGILPNAESNHVLLVSGSADKTVRLWNLGSGQCVATLQGHRSGIATVAGTDESALLVSGDASGSVKVWHLGTRELLRSLSGHHAQVSALALVPGAETVISGSWDMTLKQRNLSTGGLVQQWSGHQLPISSVVLSGDRRSLVTGSHDCTIRVWDWLKNQAIATLTGHTGAVETLTFLPNGNLVSGSRDGSIRVWQLDF